MGRIVYSLGCSVDGFVEDPSGSFDWSAPPDDLHRVANESARNASAFLFGRRIFELMEGHWPAAAERGGDTEVEDEFAKAYVETPRIVFSDSLEGVPDGVRLVRSADARSAVEELKAESEGHLELAGPTLAASMLDLIDEFRPWVAPVLVGSGKRFFPEAPETLRLKLIEAQPYSDGYLALRYERAG